MSSKDRLGSSALSAVCFLAACATTPEEEAARADAQAQLSAEIGARKGKPVNQVCPLSSDGWRALGEDTILLEARSEWYMAYLSGTCDPASASMLVRSGTGSSCLSRGDTIFTSRPRSGERCVITAIHEWDDAAAETPSVSTTPTEE